MIVRVQRTSSGLLVTNEGVEPIIVGPHELPQEGRRHWHVTGPGEQYEVLIDGDVFIQPIRDGVIASRGDS